VGENTRHVTHQPISRPAGSGLPDMVSLQFQRELTSISSAYVELPVVQRLLGHVSLMSTAFLPLDQTLYEAYSAVAG
jgi:hypothetical protein